MGVIFLKSIKFIDNKGYDTDIDKIKKIQNQEIYISEPGLKSQMLKVLKNEYFRNRK